MLNLKVAMSMLAIISRLIIGFNLLVLNVSVADPVILYPQDGDTVEGVVEIIGSVPEADLSFAKVSYSYQGDEENWFLILRIDNPVEEDLLATWDTSTITDGVYRLRLTVKHLDGSKQEVILSDIRVANYSHGEDQSVGHDSEKIVNTSTPEVTQTTAVIPTPLPANPAAISARELRGVVVKGGLVGLAVVVLIIVWTRIKNIVNRR